MTNSAKLPAKTFPMKLSINIISAAVILTMALYACDIISQGDKDPEPPLEEDIQLTITMIVPTLNLRVGETHQSNYLLVPDTMVVEDLAWSSSNTEVVSVSTTGLITAVGLGHAEVKIRSAEEEAEATISIDVVPTTVNEISLDAEVFPAYINEHQTLQITFDPEDATDKSVVWETSDASIVSVDQTGSITAKKLGFAWVSVSQSAIADNAIIVPAFREQLLAASQVNSSGEKNYINVYVAALAETVKVNEVKLYLGAKGTANAEELRTVTPALSLTTGRGSEIAIEVNDDEAYQLTFGRYVRLDVTVENTDYYVYVSWMNNVEIEQK
jgi:hypothetical protein